MKLQYYFGIGIPLIIIFFIVLVSIFDFGVSISANSPEVVMLNNNIQTVRIIEIKNDFLLTRREPLDYLLCTNGSYVYQVGYEIYVDGNNADYIDYVDIQPGESKVIEIKINNLASDYNSKNFKDVDELVLFKINKYDNCRKLMDEKYSTGIPIQLNKSGYVSYDEYIKVSNPNPPSRIDVNAQCTDSDSGENYNEKGTTIGSFWDGNNGTSVDSCQNNQLTEYYCDGNTKRFNYIICPSGYACLDGACIIS